MGEQEKAAIRVFEPYFAYKKETEVAKHIKYWVDAITNDPRCKAQAFEQIKKIFGDDSPYKIKILNDYIFRVTFVQRLGKDRLGKLKNHLAIMNIAGCNGIRWDLCNIETKKRGPKRKGEN